MRQLWNLLRHGRIRDNDVGWCGQEGYWWIKPCPHYQTEEMAAGTAGCHWLDIDRIRKTAVLEYRLQRQENA
jgi:hypothetical protein